MASILQILRRIGGVNAPPTTGTVGELAFWKAGTSPYDEHALYAHDGAQWFSVLPEKLAAARAYYVAPTGLDTNDGLTATTPFKTIKHAADVACALDFNSFTVTINLADGTYTDRVTVTGPVRGKLVISGNNANPSAVSITSTGNGPLRMSNATVEIRGIKITSAYSCVLVADSSFLTISGNVELASGASGYGFLVSKGSTCVFVNGSKVTTGAKSSGLLDLTLHSAASFDENATVVYPPGAAFTVGLAKVESMSYLSVNSRAIFGTTFTGPAYTAETGSFINLDARPYTVLGGSLPPNHPDNAPLHADEGSY